MRVLFITHCTSMGGANIAMLNLIKEYQEREIQVYVILPMNGRELEEKLDRLGAIHKSIAMPWWVCEANHKKKLLSILQKMHVYMGNIRGTIQILPLIYKWRIDVIHTNSTVVVIGALAAHIARRQHVWHLREALSFFGWDFLPSVPVVRKLFRYSDRVVVVSEACGRVYEPYLVKEKMRVIYDGVDICKEKEGIWNVEDDIFHILYLGGMSESKGCWDILRAAEELKKISSRKFRIWMPGCKKNGKINAVLYNFMKENDLEFCLKPLEYLKKDNLDQLRYKMDLFIMPSSLEMFGLVTVEAMMSCVPVVASNTGANLEIIENGKTGFLYSYGDAQQLADTILQIMQGEVTVEEIVNRACKEANNKYSVPVCAENMINVYKELLSKKKTS